MKKSIMPFVVGSLAGLLVFVDYFVAPLFHGGGNFVWVAFVSWTVFFGATLKERFVVVPSYVVGFLSANLIVWLGGHLGVTSVFAGVTATFIVNALIMYLADVKFLSIAGIFVGIAITFSRAGVGLEMLSLPMLLLVITYGILGLICGYVCVKVQKQMT